MITMTHTTTGIPTVRFGSDQLVGNSVVGNSVVGTFVTDDTMMELIKAHLLLTQSITIHTNSSVIYANSLLHSARYVTYKLELS